ncbi:MAG TPA: protein kinase, partial [Gemmataceae bacterium]|nr:protein kinase [Gemmataceae bacterium]
VAEALTHAHQQGILHRDIKPSNLLLDARGTVWVTDFGLAKAEGSDDLTHTGDIVGTLRYMAPERFNGRADPRSDVYGLGITLYELLTLRPAFADSNRPRLIERVLHQDPPRPRSLDLRIARDLETIVLKAIAKDPADRYHTSQALAEDLRRFLADRAIQARRTTPLEQTWRWCRRNPGVAVLAGSIAVLIVAITIGSAMAALSLQRSNRAALERLWRAKVSEAFAVTHSGRPGQRFTSLRLIREALATAAPLGLGDEDKLKLRNAAVAALSLPDVEVVRTWDGWPSGTADVRFDAQLRRYARADNEGNVSVRRVSDDVEECLLPGKGDPAGLCMSPDGRFLAVAYARDLRDTLLQVWQIDGSSARCLLDDRALMNEYCGFTRDNGRFVYESISRLNVLDLASGVVKRWPLPGVPGQAGITAHPDGLRVALVRSINQRDVVEIRSLKNAALENSFTFASPCNCLAWHPDGNLLAIACFNEITLWDRRSGQKAAVLEGQKHDGIRLRFNRSGDRLFSSDWSGTTKMWDFWSGRKVQTLTLAVDGLAFGANDETAASTVAAEAGFRLALLHIASGQELRTPSRLLLNQRDAALSPQFDASGDLLAVSVTDPTNTEKNGLAILHWPSGQELAYAVLPASIPAQFGADGDLWTFGTTKAGLLRWPRSINPVTGALRLGPPQQAITGPLDVRDRSADRGSMVLTQRRMPVAAVIYRPDAAQRFVATGSQYDVRYAALSSDGRWVATGSHWYIKGHAAGVWDAHTGRHIRWFPIDQTCPVGFSPDNRWLVTGGDGVRLWRVDSWTQEAQVADEGDARFWAFSSDSRLLALAGYGHIRLLRPETGAELVRLTSPDESLLQPLCFSPGNTELLVRSWGTMSVAVYDLRLIRRQLGELGLDWDDPPFPERPPEASLRKPSVELVGVDLVRDRESFRQQEIARTGLALRANPFDAQAHLLMGQLLEEQSPEEAHAHYAAAVAFEPGQSVPRFYHAESALQLYRWQEVLADVPALPSTDAQFPLTRYWTGRSHAALGRHAEALADFSAALTLYGSSMSLLELRAASYEALGKPHEAAVDREAALQAASREPLAINREAWRMLAGPAAERNPRRALDLARRAVQLAPDDLNVANTLGVAEYRNGLFEQAKITLEGCLAKHADKRDAFDLFFLAMCYQRLGASANARECLAKALQCCERQKQLTPRES